MRISDWSSDVCSSDLLAAGLAAAPRANALRGGLIGGEGGGCGADDGGLLGGIGGLADGGGTGGCPLVESEPPLVEGMIRKQEIELALQTPHMGPQIEHKIGNVQLREAVCQTVLASVFPALVKKKKTHK